MTRCVVALPCCAVANGCIEPHCRKKTNLDRCGPEYHRTSPFCCYPYGSFAANRNCASEDAVIYRLGFGGNVYPLRRVLDSPDGSANNYHSVVMVVVMVMTPMTMAI